MKAKRRAIATILYAAAKGVEVSIDHLRGAISDENKGGLKATELRIIESLYKTGRKLVTDLRRVADHLWGKKKHGKSKR